MIVTKLTANRVNGAIALLATIAVTFNTHAIEMMCICATIAREVEKTI
jgi:hypothetical protein